MAEPVETPRRNLTGAAVPAIAAAALAALGALVLVSRNGADQPLQVADLGPCILENVDAVGGPINLLDSNGSQITQADFAGEPAVVYFGFAHCPDVCPGTMYTVAEALAQDTGYDVQPILITVDPARDTPAVMGQYAATEGFPSGLVGLSGSDAQVTAAAQAFRVYSSRGAANADGSYNVDHSSLLYVVDSQWRTVSIIPTMARADPSDPRSPMVPTPPAQLSACIAAGLERSAS